MSTRVKRHKDDPVLSFGAFFFTPSSSDTILVHMVAPLSLICCAGSPLTLPPVSLLSSALSFSAAYNSTVNALVAAATSTKRVQCLLVASALNKTGDLSSIMAAGVQI
ncbi:hypothetical protein AMECASPLE_020783 [Ameca splendens]|uniref:Uncharacterized protein n=1 Tax=Ameca splendens TaxID=208324 RepID=A0ABV0XGE9_9TELE